MQRSEISQTAAGRLNRLTDATLVACRGEKCSMEAFLEVAYENAQGLEQAEATPKGGGVGRPGWVMAVITTTPTDGAERKQCAGRGEFGALKWGREEAGFEDFQRSIFGGHDFRQINRWISVKRQRFQNKQTIPTITCPDMPAHGRCRQSVNTVVDSRDQTSA